MSGDAGGDALERHATREELFVHGQRLLHLLRARQQLVHRPCRRRPEHHLRLSSIDIPRRRNRVRQHRTKVVHVICMGVEEELSP